MDVRRFVVIDGSIRSEVDNLATVICRTLAYHSGRVLPTSYK